MFCGEGEDENSVKNGLLMFLPFNYDNEKINIQRISAMGFNERKIIIFEIFLAKERHVSAVVSVLTSKLDDFTKRNVFRQLESRIDDELFFFLRFDKEKLIKDDEFVLTDGGSCFHLKFCVAAYPKKRDVALNLLKSLFS